MNLETKLGGIFNIFTEPVNYYCTTVNSVTLCYDCVDYSYQDIHIVLTGLFHSISKNFILTFVPLGKWKNEKWKL